MESKKISKDCGENSRNEESEAGQVKIQHSGCPITNLPTNILSAILFRLHIKEIAFCKCVSKSLYAKISTTDFAQAEVLPIVRTVDVTDVSRILTPLEIDRDGMSKDTYSFWDSRCPDSFEHFHIHRDLDIQLKIPLRNFPMVARDTADGDEEITLKAKDHGYVIVNTCNGLLCLSEPFNGKTMVVYNPFTGDFIDLPRVTNLSCNEDYVHCGFGYSPKTNQYKVVRMFQLRSPLERHDSNIRLAQVHIVGTTSWKNIEFALNSDYLMAFPTYLNGRVHWFCHREEKLCAMVTFDCEKECFLPFPLPPLREANRDNVGLGVLGGCLCICDSTSLMSICVWVMKNYGIEKSWTRVFKIDLTRSDKLLFGLYQPIKYLDNGEVLMFNYPRGSLIYYDPSKPDLTRLEVCPGGSKYEVIAHTPSFTSLKHVLAGCNVEVLNIYSRCAGFKLKDVPRRGIRLCQKTNYFDFLNHYDNSQYDYGPRYESSPHDKRYKEYWWGKYEYCYSIMWRSP